MLGSLDSSIHSRASHFDAPVRALGWVIAFLLAIGILPSLTALSGSLAEHSSLLRLLGPINPLKAGIPLFVLYFWLRRKWLSKGLRKSLIGIVILGSAATLGGALGCAGMISPGMREWAAMTIGTLAAATLLVLEPRQRHLVIATWALLIGLLAFLDLAKPDAIDWLYNHVFDPNTRWYDPSVASVRLLTGVFGFQSFAKLLSWVPWLALAFLPALRSHQRAFYLWLALTATSTGLILSTTQRGPLLGMLLGWAAYFIHQWLRAGRRQLLLKIALAVFLIGGITFVATPREIWQGRIAAAVGASEATSASAAGAESNINFRKIMWGISLHSVAEHPLGEACIPEQIFKDRGVYSTHSHNLFLHQFRERGWLWGFLHLALWLLALLSAWKSRHGKASALFAGLICIASQGMFDHPWFVLNHAMILSLYLLASLELSLAVNATEEAT